MVIAVKFRNNLSFVLFKLLNLSASNIPLSGI